MCYGLLCWTGRLSRALPKHRGDALILNYSQEGGWKHRVIGFCVLNPAFRSFLLFATAISTAWGLPCSCQGVKAEGSEPVRAMAKGGHEFGQETPALSPGRYSLSHAAIDWHKLLAIYHFQCKVEVIVCEKAVRNSHRKLGFSFCCCLSLPGCIESTTYCSSAWVSVKIIWVMASSNLLLLSHVAFACQSLKLWRPPLQK